MNQVKSGLISFLEREDEKKMWDVYLHKVWDDTSFEDFVNKAKSNALREQGMNKRQREREVAKSQNILENFKPPD